MSYLPSYQTILWFNINIKIIDFLILQKNAEIFIFQKWKHQYFIIHYSVHGPSSSTTSGSSAIGLEAVMLAAWHNFYKLEFVLDVNVSNVVLQALQMNNAKYSFLWY